MTVSSCSEGNRSAITSLSIESTSTANLSFDNYCRKLRAGPHCWTEALQCCDDWSKLDRLVPTTFFYNVGIIRGFEKLSLGIVFSGTAWITNSTQS